MSPTHLEICGLILRETVVYAVWFVLHVSGASSLVDRRVCSGLPTRVLTLMHVKQTTLHTQLSP